MHSLLALRNIGATTHYLYIMFVLGIEAKMLRNSFSLLVQIRTCALRNRMKCSYLFQTLLY